MTTTIKDFTAAVDQFLKNKKTMTVEEIEREEAKLRGMEDSLRAQGVII